MLSSHSNKEIARTGNGGNERLEAILVQETRDAKVLKEALKLLVALHLQQILNTESARNKLLLIVLEAKERQQLAEHGIWSGWEEGRGDR